MIMFDLCERIYFVGKIVFHFTKVVRLSVGLALVFVQNWIALGKSSKIVAWNQRKFVHFMEIMQTFQALIKMRWKNSETKTEDDTNIKCWSKNDVGDAHAHEQIRTTDFYSESQYFIVKLLEFSVHGYGSLIRDLTAAADEIQRGAFLIESYITR